MWVVDQDMAVDTAVRRTALYKRQPLAHVDLHIASAGEHLGDATAGGDTRGTVCGLNDDRRLHFLRHLNVGHTLCGSDDEGLPGRRGEDERLVADLGHQMAIVGGNIDIDGRGMAVNHHVVPSGDLALLEP
ncbi:hypothetical protein D3C81_1957530 [compost metagenome]